MCEFEKFDFENYPIKLSGKTVNYICPKCKYKFQVPIEAILEFEQEDEWNERTSYFYTTIYHL